jgi:hypothetical protein
MKRERTIEKSIKSLRQQVKLAVDDLNQQAAKLVAKGAYEASQRLIESARQMIGFAQQVDTLATAWQTCRGTEEAAAQADRTPLWEYYRLIAKSLIELGGEAPAREVIAKVESLGSGQFRSGDLALTPNGKSVWERAVRRARKPMIDEGFMEAVEGGRWRLTKLGRDLPKRTKE